MLADASAAFADAGVDAQVVLERVARVTAEPLRAGCVIRLRADDPQWLDAVTIYDRNPAVREAVQAIMGPVRVHISDANPAAVVTRSGQPLLHASINSGALRSDVEGRFMTSTTPLPPSTQPCGELARGALMLHRCAAEGRGEASPPHKPLFAGAFGPRAPTAGGLPQASSTSSERRTSARQPSPSTPGFLGRGSCFTIALPYRRPPPREVTAAPTLTAPPPGAERPPAAPDVAPVRILLAEDNMANIRALSEYLRAQGCQVFVAQSGYEALVRASEAQPQLILMDIQMPGMDGLEAIRRLRAMPTYAATPIIALTALAMPGDRERCLAAGASAYMTKPVSLRNLAETIQRLIA